MTKQLTVNKPIERKIYVIRGHKVMLDKDLAALYRVKTMILNQAVKRNLKRFPSDFMFQLNETEFGSLISQIVISNRGGTRKLPYAFTQDGIAMLSSVLRSDRAIMVNIQIMRTFTRLREMGLSHKDLQRKIDELEKRYDNSFKRIFLLTRP